MKPQIGDWIRFYQNGHLVIGVVQYISKDVLGYEHCDTDAGMVRSDSVREIRRAIAVEPAELLSGDDLRERIAP